MSPEIFETISVYSTSNIIRIFLIFSAKILSCRGQWIYKERFLGRNLVAIFSDIKFHQNFYEFEAEKTSRPGPRP